MPTAIPAAPELVVTGTGSQLIHDGDGATSTPKTDSTEPLTTPIPRSDVNIRITGTRDQLFKAWPAIANLADKAGKASIQVTATSEQGFDQAWLRNAVYEPLEEADALDEDNPGQS